LALAVVSQLIAPVSNDAILNSEFSQQFLMTQKNLMTQKIDNDAKSFSIVFCLLEQQLAAFMALVGIALNYRSLS